MMREPKLGELELDPRGTQKIRQKMAGKRAVKITINIDAGALATLRSKSAKTGIPYQRLLNQALKRALQSEIETESRLDRLEKELNRLKRHLVA